MDDPIPFLKEFRKNGREVALQDGVFDFDGTKFPRDAETSFKAKKGHAYTLGAIWFLFKHIDKKHTDYVQECTKELFPVVSIVDKPIIISSMPFGQPQTGVKRDASALEEKKPEESAESIAGLSINYLRDMRKKQRKEVTSKTGPQLTIAEPEPVGGRIGQVVNKERHLSNRNSILQSKKGKSFITIVESVNNSLRAAEEKKRAIDPNKGKTPDPKKREGYDRYGEVDDNRFWKDRLQETAEFNIDTRGTFATPKTGRAPPQNTPVKSSTPVKKWDKNHVPIIIVPAAQTSPLTMYNIKEFLEDGTFTPSVEKKNSGTKLERTIYIERKKRDGLPPNAVTKFQVTEAVNRFEGKDWDKVVGCFVLDNTWQFKSWKWTSPLEIFSHVKGFYVHYEEEKVSDNVKEWNVSQLKVSKQKARKHVSHSAMVTFWDAIDEAMGVLKNRQSNPSGFCVVLNVRGGEQVYLLEGARTVSLGRNDGAWTDNRTSFHAGLSHPTTTGKEYNDVLRITEATQSDADLPRDFTTQSIRRQGSEKFLYLVNGTFNDARLTRGVSIFKLILERKRAEGSALTHENTARKVLPRTTIMSNLVAPSPSSTTSRGSSSSSLNTRLPGDHIVESIRCREYAPLHSLIRRIDPAQYHALAEEVWIFCEDFDWEILRWFSKSKEEIAPLGHLEFPDLLLKQLALGDFSMNFHRRHLAPHFTRAQMAADKLTTDKLVSTVTSMIDLLFQAVIQSFSYYPVQLRVLGMESREEGGKGSEVLTTQLREFLMWNMFPLLNRPAAFGYTDIDNCPKMKRIVDECARVVANACRQKELKNDAYKKLYEEWNDKLNEAFEAVIEAEEVIMAQKIFMAQHLPNLKKEQRNAEKLAMYIDNLLEEKSEEDMSQHGSPLDLIPARRDVLLSKFGLDWKAFKSYGDLLSYSSPSITILNPFQMGTHARVEIWIQGRVSDVVDRVFQELFHRADFMDVNVTPMANGHRQVSYRKRMPFPYSQRYVNVNTWTTVDGKEGVIYIEDNAEHQGKPKGCERARLQASGVIVRRYDEMVKMEMLWHVNLGGNVPEWMVKYWTNITAKSLTVIAKKVKETVSRSSFKEKREEDRHTVTAALQKGTYGVCVYESDNDVCEIRPEKLFRESVPD
ncbi:hypothetical protein PROFUN_08752 [Planoprotostelium fungivorum]|uniref:Uncharacterized protein n=1 Tax=Planoprotostelium fungivorum TaxID=1890364 RepID=A0A2P6ND62_9EUKA|nr:hypothetical protein PROFUN_08752 [Planoprotostelium fungivorum]